MHTSSVIEVWSPGKWLGVRFFVSQEGQWYIRVGHGRRLPITKEVTRRRHSR